MTKNLLKQRNRAITWGLILGVGVAFLPLIVFGAVPFEDSFNYELGNLTGQGGWLDWGGAPSYPPFKVVAEGYSGYGASSWYGGVSNPSNNFKTGASTTEGSLQFHFKVSASGSNPWQSGRFSISEETEDQNIQLDFDCKDGNCEQANGVRIRYVSTSSSPVLGYVEANTWTKMSVEWDTISNTQRFKIAENDWSDLTEIINEPESLAVIKFYGTSYVSDFTIFFDEIETGVPPPPPELRVWGISPVSGTSTATTTINFTFGWEGWDFEDIYKDFVLSFYEKNTGIVVGSVIYEPTTITGSSTLALSSFGFYKTGDYYFKTKARSPLYEYTAYYTTDLVSPVWWINLNVAGWSPVFEMPDYTTWYAENSKFATSTAIFTGITNFLSPIFGKIGEFGNSVVAFLDLDEAYDRGYDLGLTIPLFSAYVSEIEVFFGGFPIIQLFLAFLVILLGIFIVRLILKFIPGLG